MNPPITPGEILLEEYLISMGISQNAMARAIGVAPRAINEIIHARRSITPAMSIRFGAFFGQSPEFWHGIQVECDFRALAKDQQKLTAHIQPAMTIARAS
jgi:addiction module HigA family antidote